MNAYPPSPAIETLHRGIRLRHRVVQRAARVSRALGVKPERVEQMIRDLLDLRSRCASTAQIEAIDRSLLQLRLLAQTVAGAACSAPSPEADCRLAA